MPLKPKTLSIEMSAEGFEHVTFAMLVQSNKSLKLQGFGQCMSRWLADWTDGVLNLDHVDDASLVYEAMCPREARVWVAFSPDDLKKLRDFRDFLEKRINRQLTLSATIFTLVESIYRANIRNTLA